MADSLKIGRSYMINLLLNGQQTQSIGNQSLLEGKKVKAIIVDINSQKASNGAQCLTGGSVGYLQLVNRKNEVIHNALSFRLLDPFQSNSGNLVELDTAEIDWTKSNVIFGDSGVAATNSGRTLPLLVIYE